MTTYFFTDTAGLTGRSLRHIVRSPDTIITTAVMPIAIMLLFVYVLGGAIDTGAGSGSDSYIDYMLPGILLMTVAMGISYTGYRLFNDLRSGIFDRFHSMPIARSGVLWAHVLTSIVANSNLRRDRSRGRSPHGFPHIRGPARLAGSGGDSRSVRPSADLGRSDRRPVGDIDRRGDGLFLPLHLPAVHQLGVRTDGSGSMPGRCAGSPRTSP